jgi:hypothetical protein
MGWAVGFDTYWSRDIGYGVPAVCDFPECNAEINRGLSYVCGAYPYGGEHGCGLYFCHDHLDVHPRLGISVCVRCMSRQKPFGPKPDTAYWMIHKLLDPSWEQWRRENPEDAAECQEAVRKFASNPQ